MYSYVFLCHSYRSYTFVSVCYSNILVCYSYVRGCHSYVTRMSGLVCHSYVLVCHSYVHVFIRMLLSFTFNTRMYSYVFVCHSYVLVWCFSHDRYVGKKLTSTRLPCARRQPFIERNRKSNGCDLISDLIFILLVIVLTKAAPAFFIELNS